MLSNVGQWIAAGGAGEAAGSIVGKLGRDNSLRMAGLEGAVDFGALAYVAKTDWFKDMLYKDWKHTARHAEQGTGCCNRLVRIVHIGVFAGCAGKGRKKK